MIKISPSILTADFANMGETIRKLDNAGADYIHCDVMDNIFVPNMTFGPPMVEAIRKITDKVMDVHLMTIQPSKHIEAFAKAGADIITVHAECNDAIHLHRLIFSIKELGKKVGVAINPATHPNVLEYVLDELDLVLVMTVNPGYGGQALIPQTLDKIKWLADKIAQQNLNIDIEVDGGINLETAPKVIKAGANVLVAGSAVLSSQNMMETMQSLRNS